MRTLLAALALALVAAAEDGPKTLPEATAALKRALADELPNEAAALLTQIQPLYKACKDEKRQKDAVATIGKACRSDDLRIRHGAFATLAVIKVKGTSKYVKKWLSPPKRFKGEIPPTYVEAIRTAGAIADVSTLSTLEKLSDHQDLPIATAATESLGGYCTLPTKRRKGLAFDLIDRLERLSAKQRRKQSEDVYVRKAALAGATVKALQGVTGEKLSTVQGWQRWKERAERQANPFE